MTTTKNFGSYQFRLLLKITEVDGEDEEGFIVRYKEISNLPEGNCVYLITSGKDVLYCGIYQNHFKKRWLYVKKKYLYHNKRHGIARKIQSGHNVCVYGEKVSDLNKAKIDTRDQARLIEKDIIKKYAPPWNRSSSN